MRIGITERGDAARDFSWVQKLNTPEFDGAVLITKTISKDFANAVLAQTKPIIVHCTCTGYGGTEMEPNAYPYKDQLNAMKHLIDAGFPKHRMVLRVDPIFPTQKGLLVVHEMLEHFCDMNTGVNRIRFSIVDQYNHVLTRFQEKGWGPVYPNGKPTEEQLLGVIGLFEWFKRDNMYFETCAEPELVALAKRKGQESLFEEVGCVSLEDLFFMDFEGFSKQNFKTNLQKRHGCRCLSCKTEMLTHKHPCANGCVYCYWKN